ncbi:MAG: TetR/AcrR family transcriptional regulator [Candidatus Adiutricales bacterium]
MTADRLYGTNSIQCALKEVGDVGLGQTEDQDKNNPRQRLLNVAAALFAEKGYASASVREIVHAAGVTKPVLYYYFNNKEGIFRAILEFAEEKHQEILTDVAQSQGVFFERIILLYQKFGEGISRHQNEFKLLINLFFGPSQGGAPEYDLEVFPSMLIEVIQSLYQDGVVKGQVIETDPETVALLFLSLFKLFLPEDGWLAQSDDTELPLKVVRLAFRGLEKN